jgi:hypothetical protein
MDKLKAAGYFYLTCSQQKWNMAQPGKKIHATLSEESYSCTTVMYVVVRCSLQAPVACCYDWPTRAVSLCDSLWNILICTVQHFTLLAFFEFGIFSLMLFSVVVGQCWRLLSSRWPFLVIKADGLPTGCCKHGCGWARSTIFFTGVSLKFLCES